MNILVVEDQHRLGQFLKESLSAQGFTVTWVQTCKDARDSVAQKAPDLVILDWGLPDGDGLELLAWWRRGGGAFPIIVLSTRDAVEDRIKGLNVGADDYLPKPFSFEELHARIRTLLRRQSSAKNTLLEHHGIRLDLLARVVTCAGQRIDLTNREFALLELFMQNPGRVLPRTMICKKIWEGHYDIDSNLLEVYVSRLRTKLEQAAGETLFRTVRSVGYQLL